MATTSNLFVAVTQRSSDSKVAQVMNMMNEDRVVYFVLRSGTEEQREALHDLLQDTLLVMLPIVSKRHPRSRRMMYVCKAVQHVDDLAHIASYKAVLANVFGEKCRITPRVVKREHAFLARPEGYLKDFNDFSNYTSQSLKSHKSSNAGVQKIGGLV